MLVSQRAPFVLSCGDSLPYLVGFRDAERRHDCFEGLAGADEALKLRKASLHDRAAVICIGFRRIFSLGKAAERARGNVADPAEVNQFRSDTRCLARPGYSWPRPC